MNAYFRDLENPLKLWGIMEIEAYRPNGFVAVHDENGCHVELHLNEIVLQ